MAEVPQGQERDSLAGQRTSSPASTGGAGTFFEQHVAAYWLAQLLVGGIPPILTETIVSEVRFQTEHLGWHTDDFLIVCERPGEATVHKLAGQVKRNFTVSAADDDCKSTIQDFWNDFKNADLFSQTEDRLLLVTQRGTNTLLKDFVGLLDCARAARDGEDFQHRLTTQGFISNKAVHYCSELCKIITDLEGSAVTAVDIWSFLRLLHVLSLDLDTSTRQTEALIKSLLARTVVEGEADASWNALLAFASTVMSGARSLRRTDLPTELQHRHGSLGVNEQRVLQSLMEHTAPVLGRIRSTIGPDFHLQRASLVQKVLSALESAQVVLVSGPAGSGKSAISKAAASLLSQNHFVFGFRVEEFAQAHIDATLHAGQIPTNAKKLTAILAAQGRKIVLIESVERLLEKTTRDAFSDLMTLAAADRGLYIILTCRDYSVDQVRASFLQPEAISSAVVSVPPLDDAELAEVEAALSELAHPLENPALRDILRNPYFLDKALEIPWSADRPVPESEREFRALFWSQIVRADHQRTPAGMARQREVVFQEIAVRRGRALSDYVICNDLGPGVVDALIQDSLVIASDENPLLLAPAHDVLEDWAILNWMEEQRLTNEGSYRGLSSAIGTHPAIRRTYRKWVAELVERSPEDADRLFRTALSETEVSAQFRDDTIVSLLKAPSSPAFLIRHEAQLLANDKALLKRVIHLLRVACMTTPHWLADTAGHISILNVPDGPSWATVLGLVHRNIDSFTPQEHPQLLGLIEDAVRDVSWRNPELEGAEFVAGIGHWLLAGFDSYGDEELHKRVFKVIAKIPTADPIRFEAILRGTEREDQRRDHIAEDFRSILFSSVEGMPAARNVPDLVASVATDYLLVSEDEIQREPHHRSPIDVEIYFGIKERLHSDFFPAGAYRGPWISLLRHHPRRALDFFISIFNHSADWYVHPRISNPLEPAWEITLTFPDGSTRTQWGNPRLWNLYRGTSVGPYVLQSLLMALEKWLLEYAEASPEQLDTVLVDILRRSESAALTAVVAGVATAHPHESVEVLLVLLGAPDYIAFDHRRMVHESEASTLQGIVPQFGAEIKIYEEERKKANRLSHRRQHLETAILNLQLGPHASRVHAMLDQHLAELPPQSERDESDRLWRLALHRMDLRQYTVSDTNGPEPLDGETTSYEPPQLSLRPEPNALDAETQAMVDESVAVLGTVNTRIGVLLWGCQVFERENGDHDPSRWREKLVEARTMDRETEYVDGSRDAPGFIAAVCVRDYWDEMSVDEQDWCVEVVCAEILRKSDQWNYVERVQQSSMSADWPCASVVPLLLGKSLVAQQTQYVRQAFATALLHPVKKVRWYATRGIDGDFWAADRAVAMRCVNAIATEATLLAQAWQAEGARPYNARRQIDEIIAEAATTVREYFWQADAIVEDAHIRVDISSGFGAETSVRILAILEQVPHDPFTVDAFARASRTLVGWWDAGRDRERREDRNFHTENAVSQRLQQFVMRTTPASALQVLRPVLDAIERHPREISHIVEGLTAIEDHSPNTAQYWYLWGLFADGIKRASWVAGLDDEYPIGSDMISAIFLASGWKDDVTHWRSLEGYAHHVHELFEALPPSSVVLGDYARFLYHIGEQSLPDAFVRVADSLQRGDAQAMLVKSNTVFLLEVLLQRHVYGRPLELKSNTTIRQAILSLLDILVESGSSAAFRMRDDFVTPVT